MKQPVLRLKSVFVAGCLFLAAACSPLEVCYSDSTCAAHERCYKGEEESSAIEGICLAPDCNASCQAPSECVWDAIQWEARCVASGS